MWWTFFNDKYGKFCFKEINYKLMNNKNENLLRNITIEKNDYWKIWKYCHWQFKNIVVRNFKTIAFGNE